MGGGKGNNRSRRQKQKQSAAAARAVAAARSGKRDLTKVIGAVVVIVVIAAAVVGGVLYEQHKKAAAAETVIPAKTVAGSADYPVTLDRANATVLAGKPGAKVTIDAYEDFECPVCREFEAANFTDMEKQLDAGTVRVRYHMLNLLDNSSVPPGYSSMSANTALAVATVAPDKFIDFHYSLYQTQPAENGPGWTQAQLSSLANRLGVHGAEFDKLIEDRTYYRQIQANLDNATKNKALFQQAASGPPTFGTPTIVVNGKVVNWQADPSWLSDAVKAA